MKHSLIIGGGIAGLVTAQVLLQHCEKVTLIERDHYPDTPVFRPGVPQARQVHTMLLRGQQALEKLFPGLEKKLLAQGAIVRDYGAESLYYYGGGRCPRIPPVLHGWNCSRILLEWQLRQELLSSSHFTLLEGYVVENLLFEERRISGVTYRARNHDTIEQNALQQCKADLVIDASGSSSIASKWLQKAGYGTPLETKINPELAYATRFYEPPQDFQDSWKGIAIQAITPFKRGGVLMEIEGGTWMVVLSGERGDVPPTKEQGFLAFAHSLPEQALYEAIKEAKPLSPIYGYRRMENRWYHFERFSHWPKGFIVLGDAVASFNPIFGQGMTVAVLEACALDSWLRSSTKSSPLSFQKNIARLVNEPWKLATASDLVSQKKTKSLRTRYSESILRLLPQDAEVLLSFLQVIHMLNSPLSLLHPSILAKVIIQKYTKSKSTF